MPFMVGIPLQVVFIDRALPLANHSHEPESTPLTIHMCQARSSVSKLQAGPMVLFREVRAQSPKESTDLEAAAGAQMAIVQKES